MLESGSGTYVCSIIVIGSRLAQLTLLQRKTSGSSVSVDHHTSAPAAAAAAARVYFHCSASVGCWQIVRQPVLATARAAIRLRSGAET